MPTWIYRPIGIFYLLILQLHPVFAQTGWDYKSPAPATTTGDELFTAYLSDTLRPTQKIKELINTAKFRRDRQETSHALQCYQVAIALEPYVHDEPHTLFRLHADFAGLLNGLGANEFAMQNWKKALGLYRSYHPDATVESCNIMGSMVGYYIQSAQYDSAFYYYDLALLEAERTGLKTLISSAHNNIGMLKAKNGDYAGAHQYYQNAVAILEKKNRADSSMFCSINDNLAELAILEKDWDKALDCYTENIRLLREISQYYPNDSRGLLQAYCGKVNVLMKTRNLITAGKEIQYADSIVAHFRYMITEKYIRNYYTLKYEYARLSGNPAEMEIYHSHLLSLSDSLQTISRSVTDPLSKAMVNITINKFDKDVQLYRLQLAEKERDLEEARKKQLRNFLIAAVTILFSIVTFLYFRNRNRLQKNEIRLQQYKHDLAEKELENKKLEQEKTERELHHKKSDLRDLGVYLSQLKQLHFSMAERLDTIKSQKPDQIKDAIVNLVREWDTEIYSQQHLHLIQENIDQVNSEFYSNLRRSYPELTKSEVELCGLLKLNLSSKEIGVMKGISQESVKMARYRLRKKLKLNPEDDIYHSLSLI